jgi:hypothetical protein
VASPEGVASASLRSGRRAHGAGERAKWRGARGPCALGGRRLRASCRELRSRRRGSGAEPQEDALPCAASTRAPSPPQQVKGGDEGARPGTGGPRVWKVSGALHPLGLGVPLARNAAAADFSETLHASVPAAQQADSSRWRLHFSGGNLRVEPAKETQRAHRPYLKIRSR